PAVRVDPADVLPAFRDGTSPDGAGAGFETETDTDLVTPPFRRGLSLDYLNEIGQFACDLADRGRVLPTVTDEDGAPAARWRPVIRGGDVAVVQSLVAALPPICRAGIARPDPHDVVTHALRTMVDAAVRGRLPADMRL